MRSRFSTQDGTEALFNGFETSFSSQNNSGNLTNGFSGGSVGFGTTGGTGLTNASNPAALNPEGSQAATTYPVDKVCVLMTLKRWAMLLLMLSTKWRSASRKLSVTAKSRALKAEYSLERH